MLLPWAHNLDPTIEDNKQQISLFSCPGSIPIPPPAAGVDEGPNCDLKTYWTGGPLTLKNSGLFWHLEDLCKIEEVAAAPDQPAVPLLLAPLGIPAVESHLSEFLA